MKKIVLVLMLFVVSCICVAKITPVKINGATHYKTNDTICINGEYKQIMLDNYHYAYYLAGEHNEYRVYLGKKVSKMMQEKYFIKK